MVIHIKLKRCKHCTEKNLTNNQYCSFWCLEESKIKYIEKKKKDNFLEKAIERFRKSLRYCKCGVLLNKGQHKCYDCQILNNKRYGK